MLETCLVLHFGIDSMKLKQAIIVRTDLRMCRSSGSCCGRSRDTLQDFFAHNKLDNIRRASLDNIRDGRMQEIAQLQQEQEAQVQEEVKEVQVQEVQVQNIQQVQTQDQGTVQQMEVDAV